MLSLATIREQLQKYLANAVDLDQFEDWLASSSWNMHLHADADSQQLASAIELRLAEYSSGHLDERDLQHEFQMFLLYGSKLPTAEMLVFSPLAEGGTSASSTSTPEAPPIQRFVIGGNYLTSVQTRSAAGRNITAIELIEQLPA